MMPDNDLTPQAAIRAFVFSPPATPATPTAVQPAPTQPVTPPVVEPHSKNGLSAAEAATMADWTRKDLASGKISSEQAEKIFSELNTPMELRTPDARGEEKQMDQVFGVPAKPEEYLIPYGKPGEAIQMTEQIKAFDGAVSGWMADSGMTREFGNSVVTIISKAIQHTATMTAEQREIYKDQENEKLHQLFGGQDKLEAQLQPAARMIDEIDRKRPGLKEFVRAHGDNAMFVAQLIQAARIYHARKGRR